MTIGIKILESVDLNILQDWVEKYNDNLLSVEVYVYLEKCTSKKIKSGYLKNKEVINCNNSIPNIQIIFNDNSSNNDNNTMVKLPGTWEFDIFYKKLIEKDYINEIINDITT